MADRVSPCRGLRGDGSLALLTTSYLSSYATTRLRATCRDAKVLFTRHCPVPRGSAAFHLELCHPHFATEPKLERLQGKNRFSPVHCFRFRWACMLKFAEVSNMDCELGNIARKLLRLPNFALGAVTRSPRIFEYLDVALRNDLAIADMAVRGKWEMIKYIGGALRLNRDLALVAVRRSGRALGFLDRSFTNDKEIVTTAVKEWSLSANYIGEELRTDADYMLRTSQVNAPYWPAYSWILTKVAAPVLFKDKEFCLAAIKITAEAFLRCQVTELREDRAFVYSCAKRCGHILKYTPEFQDDYNFVIGVVRHRPLALQFASSRLKKDHTLVRAAARRSGYIAMRFCDPSLRSDRETVKLAVEENPQCLEFVDPSFRADLEIMRIAVERDRHFIHFALPDIVDAL